MAAWRYEISLLVLKKYFTRSRSEIFFQHEKRNFVSPSGHVISSLYKLNSKIIGCVDIILTMCSVHCLCFFFSMDLGEISLDRPHLSLKALCQAVQFILFNFANYSPSIGMELKVSK